VTPCLSAQYYSLRTVAWPVERLRQTAMRRRSSHTLEGVKVAISGKWEADKSWRAEWLLAAGKRLTRVYVGRPPRQDAQGV